MLKTIIIFKIALKIMNNCNFTSVSISNGFNLYLSQGDSESVNITIDKDLEKYLVVKVERGELKIYLKRRFSLSFSNRRKEMKAVVVVKDINRLSVSGGGRINTEMIKSDELGVKISGGGHATLYGSVTDLSIKTSGGGIISAKNLNAENYKLSMSGGSIASINVSENLDLSAAGGVIVKCYSRPSNIDKSVSGGSILRIIR